MKTLQAMAHVTAFASAVLFTAPTDAQTIDPATGMPVRSQPSSTRLDPATGMPAPADTGMTTPEMAAQASFQTAQDVKQLIFNGRYEEALRRCLAYHNQYKTSGSLVPIVDDWVELGRRYPKARTALTRIRDEDVRKFSEGRGFFDLFMEVNSINNALDDSDSPYQLFTSLRAKDAPLAQQCYGLGEDLLVAKGEYQWCYDHMGDAQEKYNFIHQALERSLEQQKRVAAINEASRQRSAAPKPDTTAGVLPYSLPDTSAIFKTSAEKSFISHTRQLIEILVATGHRTEAEKIQDHAAAVLDDARLKSAVSDAETKVAGGKAPGQPH